MSSDITPRREPGILSAGLITLISIGVISAIDSAFNEVTCAPVIGVCTLFILALRYPPRIVALCFVPLLLFVGFRMWHILAMAPANAAQLTRYWIRILTFAAAGGIAIAASAYRARLYSVTFQLLRILEAIPLPLIISDASGTIRAVSEETCASSGLTRESLVGFRLSDVVGYHLLEEADENWYAHWLESPEGKIFDVELQLGQRRSAARVGRLGSGRHAIMIVIFV
jgi:PAS domain S-box-containing protein